MSPDVTLYHMPPSFYSQIARLVLAEKGVLPRYRFIVAGPPFFQNQTHWYLRLNPQGTVPTLEVDGASIDDSRKILREVETRFDGPPLAYQHLNTEMEAWIDRAYSLGERTLAYGQGIGRVAGRLVNSLRMAHAKHHQRSAPPDLQAVYDRKIADITSFMADTADRQGVGALIAQYNAALDGLNEVLEQREFIAGESYTLADVVWTVAVARQHMLGFAPLVDRPHLATWYRAVRGRPSFDQADVWEHPKPQKVIPHLLYLLRWRLLVALGLATAIAAAIWWAWPASAM